MTAALRAAAARRQRYDEAVELQQSAEQELEQMRQLAARWRREVGTLAEQLEAHSGPMQLLRGVFGGGGDRARVEQELAEARRKHDEADDAVPDLERRCDAARAEVAELRDAPAAFAELLAEREVELRERGGELADRLEASAQALLALEEECELLAKVVTLGRDAEGELLVARQCLAQARQALGADVLGGAIVTGKVPVLGDAVRHLQAAARNLDLMGNEMAERAAVMRRITFPGGQHLADMVFDKLPHDLFVHRRIHQAADDVMTTIDQLRGAMWSAEAACKQLEQSIRAASDERAAWIVQAD